MANTNKFYLGGILIDALYLGENRINKLCLGENVIYNAEPSGPVINVDDYVTFEALEDGFTVTLSRNATEYCIDGDGDWKTLSSGTTSPSINNGQTISLRGNCTITSSTGTTGGIGRFTLSKKCNVRGNAMALLYGDSGKDNVSLSGKNYAFSRLFESATTIQSVSSDFLPATTVSQYCYYRMFYGCSSLTTAPTLPAVSLGTSQRYCYQYMFYNCSKLNYIKAMFTTDPGSRNSSSQAYYTYNWVSGVASSGTFVKNSSATWNRTGAWAVPSGWTVQTANS